MREKVGPVCPHMSGEILLPAVTRSEIFPPAEKYKRVSRRSGNAGKEGAPPATITWRKSRSINDVDLRGNVDVYLVLKALSDIEFLRRQINLRLPRKVSRKQEGKWRRAVETRESYYRRQYFPAPAAIRSSNDLFCYDKLIGQRTHSVRILFEKSCRLESITTDTSISVLIPINSILRILWDFFIPIMRKIVM